MGLDGRKVSGYPKKWWAKNKRKILKKMAKKIDIEKCEPCVVFRWKRKIKIIPWEAVYEAAKEQIVKYPDCHFSKMLRLMLFNENVFDTTKRKGRENGASECV